MKTQSLKPLVKIKISLILVYWRVKQFFILLKYKVASFCFPRCFLRKKKHECAYQKYQQQEQETKQRPNTIYSLEDESSFLSSFTQEVEKYKLLLILYASCKSSKTNKIATREVLLKIEEQRNVITTLLKDTDQYHILVPNSLTQVILNTPLSVLTNVEIANKYCKHINRLISQIKVNNAPLV